MAAFMAGGSLAVLPKDVKKDLLNVINMKPAKSTNKSEYILSNGKESIVYNVETKQIERR